MAKPVGILQVSQQYIPILPNIVNAHTIRVMRINFVCGTINGVPVVVGDTGSGKVNAALVSTLLIQQFHVRCILFNGYAISLNSSLRVGDIVMGSHTAQFDVGELSQGMMKYEYTNTTGTNTPNPLYFPADQSLLRLAEDVVGSLHFSQIDDAGGLPYLPRIISGTVVTGDILVNSQRKKELLKRYFHADALDRETAAIAQVCWEERTPYLSVITISRLYRSDTRVDLNSFHKDAASNIIQFDEAIISRIGKH